MSDEAETRTQIEAAAFRRLVEHLREHPEVQNIDLMNLAGFCRNCLARWYAEAAAEHGLERWRIGEVVSRAARRRWQSHDALEGQRSSQGRRGADTRVRESVLSAAGRSQA